MRQDSARRLSNGKPLRDAMKAGGWHRTSLAARTTEIDPNGQGVSHQLIAFLATTKPWGRDTCSAWTAWLIATALDVPEDALFAATVTPVPEDSAEGRQQPSAA